MPSILAAPVVRHTAALRPVTPDVVPMLCTPEGWDNVFLVLGGGRKGVLLSAGMAHAAAEFVDAFATAPLTGVVQC